MPRGRGKRGAPARNHRPREATVPDDSGDTWHPSIGISRSQKYQRLDARAAFDSYPLMRSAIKCRETERSSSPAICLSSEDSDESTSSLDRLVDFEAIRESVHSSIAARPSSSHSSIVRRMEACEQLTQGDDNGKPETLVHSPAAAPPSSALSLVDARERVTQDDANGKSDTPVHSPAAAPPSSSHSSIACVMEACEQVTQGDANGKPDTPVPSPSAPRSIARLMDAHEQVTQGNANGKTDTPVHSPACEQVAQGGANGKPDTLVYSPACEQVAQGGANGKPDTLVHSPACEQVTQGDVNGKPDTPVHSPAAAPPSSAPKPDSPLSDVSISVNLTEMVNMFHTDDSGDPEVTSNSPSKVEVIRGCRVKPSSARILRAIVNKHGDISSSCSLQGLELRSFFLQRVCDIVEALEDRNIREVTLDEVKKQLDEVSGFREVLRMDVDWLVGRLERICEAKEMVKEICGFKERRGILVQERDEAEKELVELEQRKCVVEKRKSVAESEILKIYRFGFEAKPKLLCFEKKGSLIDGLLADF